MAAKLSKKLTTLLSSKDPVAHLSQVASAAPADFIRLWGDVLRSSDALLKKKSKMVALSALMRVATNEDGATGGVFDIHGDNQSLDLEAKQRRVALGNLIHTSTQMMTVRGIEVAMEGVPTDTLARTNLLKQSAEYGMFLRKVSTKLDSMDTVLSTKLIESGVSTKVQRDAFVTLAQVHGGFGSVDRICSTLGASAWIAIAKDIAVEDLHQSERRRALWLLENIVPEVSKFNDPVVMAELAGILQQCDDTTGLSHLSGRVLTQLLSQIPYEKAAEAVSSLLNDYDDTILRAQDVVALSKRFPERTPEFMTNLISISEDISARHLAECVTPADWKSRELILAVNEYLENGAFDGETLELLSIMPVDVISDPRNTEVIERILSDTNDFIEIPKKLREVEAVVRAFIANDNFYSEEDFLDVFKKLPDNLKTMPEVLKAGKFYMGNGLLRHIDPEGFTTDVALKYLQGISYSSNGEATPENLQAHIKDRLLKDLTPKAKKRWEPVVDEVVSSIKGFRHAATKQLIPLDLQWGFFLTEKQGLPLTAANIAKNSYIPIGVGKASPFSNFNAGTYEAICATYKVKPYVAGDRGIIGGGWQKTAFNTSKIFKRNVPGAIKFLETNIPPSIVVATTENKELIAKVARNNGVAITSNADTATSSGKKAKLAHIVWDGKAELPTDTNARVLKVSEDGGMAAVSIRDSVRRSAFKVAEGMRMPSAEFSAEWASFLVKYPQAAKKVGLFPEIEAKFGIPKTLAEFNQNVVLSSYEVDSSNPVAVAIANRCAALGVEEEDFYKVMKHSTGPKTSQELPNIIIKNGDYTLSQVAPGDVRALMIGEESSCCQHVGGVGESVAVHSFKEPSSCVYVIEKNEECIAQSWVWLSKDGTQAVADSVESKFDNKATILQVATMYCQLAEKLKEHGIALLLTSTGYGMTSDVNRALGLKKADLVETPDMKVRCDYSDADEQSYSTERLFNRSITSTRATKPVSVERAKQAEPGIFRDL